MRFSACPRRKDLAEKYANGVGLEIGALSVAWPVNEKAHVKYIDRFTRAELIQQYPEVDPSHLPETDLIDDGRFLNTIESVSQDFVLNSHVLEHSDNPLRTMERWLEVLRIGGVILGAVPNKDHTFDRDRPITAFEEIESAYNGDQKFKLSALRSFHQFVDKLSGQALESAIINSIDKDLHFHFPVWDFQSFRGFLANAMAIQKIKFKVEELFENGGEILFVLRRI